MISEAWHSQSADEAHGAQRRHLLSLEQAGDKPQTLVHESGRSLQEIAKSGLLTVASLDEVRAVFETNVFGVIAVTQAMFPLLREAPAARIVNVSSTSGSLTWNSDSPVRGIPFGRPFEPATLKQPDPILIELQSVAARIHLQIAKAIQENRSQKLARRRGLLPEVPRDHQVRKSR